MIKVQPLVVDIENDFFILYFALNFKNSVIGEMIFFNFFI